MFTIKLFIKEIIKIYTISGSKSYLCIPSVGKIYKHGHAWIRWMRIGASLYQTADLIWARIKSHNNHFRDNCQLPLPRLVNINNAILVGWGQKETSADTIGRNEICLKFDKVDFTWICQTHVVDLLTQETFPFLKVITYKTPEWSATKKPLFGII